MSYIWIKECIQKLRFDRERGISSKTEEYYDEVCS